MSGNATGVAENMTVERVLFMEGGRWLSFKLQQPNQDNHVFRSHVRQIASVPIENDLDRQVLQNSLVSSVIAFMSNEPAPEKYCELRNKVCVPVIANSHRNVAL